METFLFGLAVVTAAVFVAVALEVFFGVRSIRHLHQVAPLPLGAPAPEVSIVIPARNEEKRIEEALRSVLAQDYQPLEFILVDDRSEDRTGAILDRMAAADPRLQVVHVAELPPGWMGKNHALHLGAHRATGEVLLFTDADIVMAPTTLRRAVAYLQEQNLDHLTAAPWVRMPGVLLESFIGTFALFFAQFTRPWKVKDPKSPKHLGIGAFNLVRASVYKDLGGHAPIALRPDDDLKLGKLFKKNGRRQEFVYARDLIQVQWYDSVGELIHGLEKNSFAGLEYRVGAVIAAVTSVVALHLWPWVAVFVTQGPTRWLNAAVIAILLLLCWWNAPLAGVRRWLGIFYPVATALFAYIIVRSTILTLRQGGVRWRGTLYPLAALKANKV
jgi:glycosyltransferase involved in cell wall biosynthesis